MTNNGQLEILKLIDEMLRVKPSMLSGLNSQLY